MSSRVVDIAALCVFLACYVTPAVAQTFPGKSVRMVNPYAAGGSSDILGRVINPYLSQRWGHQVYLDSRPGGNTLVGTEIVVKSPPDGHTLLITSSALSVNAAVYPKLTYDTLEDLVPLITVAVTPQALVAHPSLPVKSIKELIALAKARPGQLNYGDSGPATRIAGQLFNMLAGIDLNIISYKGAGPMMTELMGGHISLAIGAVSSVQAAVRSGRVRLLGVGSLTPSSMFPDAPVIAKDVPGFEAVIWFGLLAPRGTPKEVVARIQRDVTEVLRMPEVNQRLLETGAEPAGHGPEELGNRIRGEIVRFRKVVQAAGIKPE